VEVNHLLPARSAQIQVQAITNTLAADKPQKQTDILKVLRRVAEEVPPRGVVVLFSDLLTDREPIFKGLEMLRHRKHDVMVFHILDDDEVTFNFGGMTRFEGLEDLPNLLCDPKALRESYLEVLEEYFTEVRRGCSRLGVDYLMVKTSDYLDVILSRFLFSRMAANKAGGRR
jgi:uncharacterized protein (DUF58 family)